MGKYFELIEGKTHIPIEILSVILTLVVGAVIIRIIRILVRKMLPRKVSSMAIAVQTPFNPNFGARLAASVNRTNHIEQRLMMAGIIVSPAPINTPLATMAAANIGSAQASMRSTSVPRAITSSTGDMMPISSGAKTHIRIPIRVITAMPSPTDILANERVSSFCPAPMPCPTRVVAASAMP